MGRPLYSSTFKTAVTPAVRDPEPPICETWSYLNAFDPDSDDFFDNENAVYEDFVSPVSSINPEDEEEDEEERDMLVVRMGNASPITSESSLSDSDSSFAVGADDHDSLHQIAQESELSALIEPAVRVRLAARASPQTTDTANVRSHPRHIFATTAAIRTVSYRPHPQRDEAISVPAPSAPIPVPAASRRTSTVDERAVLSPSTPPRQTPLAHFPMSPPPASTPRLYSWARNPIHTPSSSSGGPFTNPHARTSYAHLSPAFIRIRDVTV